MVRITLKCKRHPKYSGKRAPVSKDRCDACWVIYDEARHYHASEELGVPDGLSLAIDYL